MNNVTEMSVDDILSQFTETQTNQNAPEVSGTTLSTSPLAQTSITGEDTDKSVDEIIESISEENVSTKDEDTEEKEEVVVSKGRPKGTLDPSELASVKLLIDNGKIQPWVNDQNEIVLPTTKQELLELMDENLETINQNSYQAVTEQFYQTKSPVWQQLLKYSESARSLDEVAPLFSAMQDMETIHNLDLENENHQEYIIKQLSMINGLDADTADNEIEDLKERGKLKERAEKLKPGLDRYNEQKVQQELVKKQQEDQQKQYLLQNHYNNVVENVMNRKEIGGVKMKDEHRQYIASTLVPDDNLGGLPIYTIIDNLLQKGDFDTLARIALLGSNPKVHDNYYNSKNSNEVAAGLQRTLRTANTPKTESIVNDDYSNQTEKAPTNWINKSKKYL